MKYILALDQGTTSSRAIVFDRQGAVVTTAPLLSTTMSLGAAPGRESIRGRVMRCERMALNKA